MKKLIIFLLAAILPLAASAQISESDPTSDLGARIGASIDGKLAKGLHIQASGDVRLSDNFSSVGRFDAGLGITYKPISWLKLGAGYMFIERQSSSAAWKTRHRVYADARVGFGTGDWRFSIKERLQLTHKDVQAYKHQTTPNSLTLKSRAKLSYRGFEHFSPYGYLELRNVFNDPSCTAVWSSVSEAFGDYSFTGYNHAYFNRLRGSIGTEYKIDKHNALDFYLLADWCRDKNVDTADMGTRLKSLSWEKAFNTAICLEYKFSF